MGALLYVYGNLVDNGNLVYYSGGMTNRCNHILGPCVDGTMSGRRCSNQALPNAVRCARHAPESRREPGEDFDYAIESEDEWL